MKSNLIKNISPTLIGTVLVIIEILLSAIIIKKISCKELYLHFFLVICFI